MGEAYTPGLQVKEFTMVQKRRMLPIPGDVLVKEGAIVAPDTVVAKTTLLGDIGIIDIASTLGITAGQIKDALAKGILKVNVGSAVKKDEIIAFRKYFFNLKQKSCISPMTGTVEHLSDLTGKMHIRGPPIPVTVNAYIPGKVEKVLPKEGVIIKTFATYIQGILGVGGEKHAELSMAVDSPNEILTPDKITPDHTGKIIVGGSIITGNALKKAIEESVKGIIVGAIEDKVLINFLGYEIGVAITGHEDINTTLILTEGFGKINISNRTFDLLKKHEGKKASINGATQIRAGVIRPEIIIPLREQDAALDKSQTLSTRLQVGTDVRIIRGPDFGVLGKVTNLETKLQEIGTESRTVVIGVRLEDGRQTTVPRANVEIIEV